jgi:Domain of unknown function (DUF4160)
MERFEVPISEGHDRDRDDPDEFFDMANLFPKHTGLPFVVWISYRGAARHDIRVKVSPGPKALPLEMASIAIRPDIRVVEGSLSGGDLALLSKWIEMNRDVLLRYWEGDIDTKDAIEAIQPIG